MKQIVFFMLFLISVFSLCQITFDYSNADIKSFNNNNQKDGLWVYYIENKLNVIANFSNDSLIDILYRPACSNENSRDYIYKQYKHGRLWNVLYKYECFEQSQDAGTFYNGYGVLKTYIPLKDTGCYVLYSEVTFVNGEPNGLATYYYFDGEKKRLEGRLIPNKNNQECFSKMHVTEANDTTVSYYFNSSLEIRDGWWKYYSYDGLLALEILYDNGTIIKILDFEKPNNRDKYFKRRRKAKCITDEIKFKYYKDRLY